MHLLRILQLESVTDEDDVHLLDGLISSRAEHPCRLES